MENEEKKKVAPRYFRYSIFFFFFLIEIYFLFFFNFLLYNTTILHFIFIQLRFQRLQRENLAGRN